MSEETNQIKPFSAKSFSRLIFDAADKKLSVRLTLMTGSVFEGRFLSIDNEILAMACYKDRFDFDVVYVPLNAVVAMAVNKDLHSS